MIRRICYEGTKKIEYDFEDKMLVFFLSDDDKRLGEVTSAIALACTEDPVGVPQSGIRKSAVVLRSGEELVFPRSNQDDVFINQESFEAHVLGYNPFHQIRESFAREPSIVPVFQSYLRRLTGGQISTVTWNSVGELLLLRCDGKTKTFFEVSRETQILAALSLRLMHSEIGIYGFLLYPPSCFADLSDKAKCRFLGELAGQKRESLIIILSAFRDVMSFPWKETDLLCVDLDGTILGGKDE